MTIAVICSCGETLNKKLNLEEVENFLAPHMKEIITIDNLCKVQRRLPNDNLIICACSQNILEPVLGSYHTGYREYVDLRQISKWESDEKVRNKAVNALIEGILAKNLKESPSPQRRIDLANKPIMITGNGISTAKIALNLVNTGNHVCIISNSLVNESDQLNVAVNSKNSINDLEKIIQKLKKSENVHIYEEIGNFTIEGHVGNFRFSCEDKEGKTQKIESGLIVLGGDMREWKPPELEISDQILTWTQYQENAKLNGDVAIVQCIGSRTDERPYCSGYCCSKAVNTSIHLQENNTQVTVFHKGIRTIGNDELNYVEAREKGVHFIRGGTSSLDISSDGKIIVAAENVISQTKTELLADHVILSAAMLPNELSINIAQALGIPLDPDSGFITPIYTKLRTERTQIPGVFTTINLTQPASIIETSHSVDSVSLEILRLVKNGMTRTNEIAIVEEEKCTKCEICVTRCPAQAIDLTEKAVSVDPNSCQGCGLCTSVCPTGAIKLHNLDITTMQHQIQKTAEVFKKNLPHTPLVFSFTCKECSLAAIDIASETGRIKKPIIPIVFPCGGRISPIELLTALDAGADAIITTVCAHCHNAKGETLGLESSQIVRKILEVTKNEGWRCQGIKTYAAEPDRYEAIIEDIWTKLEK
ncbi:MAG: hydrogenase iron-sulfur subunit [Promethearchaeota archaeon]